MQAYDNVESSVRKAAVFCIVSLHQLVGEAALQPHLDCLNGSKMKLLSLYIKRAQAQSNAGSPRFRVLVLALSSCSIKSVAGFGFAMKKIYFFIFFSRIIFIFNAIFITG